MSRLWRGGHRCCPRVPSRVNGVPNLLTRRGGCGRWGQVKPKAVRIAMNPWATGEANSALHRIALVRMRHDPTTRAYVERRLGQNKTKKDIIRSLKRAIAREVYKALTRPHEPQSHAPARAELAAQRKAHHLTLSDAARALHTWPARISDIEKHHRPLPHLANRYHQRLTAV